MNRPSLAYFVGYALGLALGLLFLAAVLFLSVELLEHALAALR